MGKILAVSIFVCALTIGFIFFTYIHNSVSRSDVVVPDIDIEYKPFIFSVESVEVEEGLDMSTVVRTTTLQPTFHIQYIEDIGVTNFNIDGFDISGSLSLTQDSIQSPFLLKPGNHQIIIHTHEHEYVYNFTLNYTETFDVSIQDSDFLLLPKNTIRDHMTSWFVDGGMLHIGAIDTKIASLAFLYPLQDIDISFLFEAKGDSLNLGFYFLEHNVKFVVGDGGLSRHSLWYSTHNGSEHISGVSFTLQKNIQYKARVMRVQNNYALYLAELSGEWVKVIDFVDDAGVYPAMDTMGFTIASSDGVTIDNLSFFDAP